jgi:hypothetical protein
MIPKLINPTKTPPVRVSMDVGSCNKCTSWTILWPSADSCHFRNSATNYFMIMLRFYLLFKVYELVEQTLKKQINKNTLEHKQLIIEFS